MAALQSLRQLYKSFRSVTGFEYHLRNLKIISAEDGKVYCELPIEEEHLNLRGGLHGGFTATLIDSVTSSALATCNQAAFGVSVDLNVTYVSAAKQGDILNIEAEVLKRGKTLGYTTATIKNQRGEIIASGLHTKFLK